MKIRRMKVKDLKSVVNLLLKQCPERDVKEVEEHTAWHLQNVKEHCFVAEDEENIIGNIYLLKFFNKIEDVRELSALINACSRLGYSDIALSFCLGDNNAKSKAEEIYTKYKHEILECLKWVETTKHIEGKKYVIINAKTKIKDALIGTIVSIIASSFIYEEGTIIVGLAYQGNKIKVSARISGHRDKGTNLKKLMERIIKISGGEGGGHAKAAGCLIPLEKESIFIETLKKELENEEIKIKI